VSAGKNATERGVSEPGPALVKINRLPEAVENCSVAAVSYRPVEFIHLRTLGLRTSEKIKGGRR
jgi:hypothetical protein